MLKSVPAADPDAYVRALDGWRRVCVEMLRGAVRKAAGTRRDSEMGASGLRGERSGGC